MDQDTSSETKKNKHHNGFNDGVKKMGIELHKTSIGFHKEQLIRNLTIIAQDMQGTQKEYLEEKINRLVAIQDDTMGLNIIEPMIAIAAKIEGLLGSSSQEMRENIRKHKDLFSSSITSILEISKYVGDSRIVSHSIKAAKLFH